MTDDTDTLANGYRPPQSPTEDHPLALAFKIAVAMFVADLIARRLMGFDSPTWSIVVAAYLSTNPPLGSAGSAMRKVGAMLVGVCLGAAGAYAAQATSGVPSLHFVLVGVVAGWLATRSGDYVFAAVVGTIVTFVGASGGDPTIEVVVRTAIMVSIGCLVGPSVVYVVEHARARLHGRSRSEEAA